MKTPLIAPLVLCLLAACAVNPATGERQLALVSEAQEVEIGRNAAKQVQQTMAMVGDAALAAYVERAGQRLARDSERPELPWSFQVVDDPAPNAFALPGGFIYVTRGMLTLMDSEAELVSVLGHEVGHVTARHSVAQMSRAQLAQLGLGLGGALFPELQAFGDVAGLGLNLLLLKYGRDAEREADELGFRYARQEGYELSEMADVFASLARLGDLDEGSALPSWLSTHPAPEERVQAVEARLANLDQHSLDATVGRSEYLDRIDGLAYGENPRNGFFRAGTFYHPDLAFRFDVPEDWQTRNLARSVIGISPERDAAIQFTLAGETSPPQALEQFLSQQGLQPGSSGTDTINGVSAAIGNFQAQTQQGVVTGYAAFFAHGGSTYQLVTYAPAQRFSDWDTPFQQMIRSFAPLTDERILNVEPPVLEIVSLERAMTLAEFDRRHPSGIPIERLAILNQVAGAETRLAQGTLVKRVAGDASLSTTE